MQRHGNFSQKPSSVYKGPKFSEFTNFTETLQWIPPVIDKLEHPKRQIPIAIALQLDPCRKGPRLVVPSVSKQRKLPFQKDAV